MIIVVIGVAGSGKTTLGKMLAERLHFAFFDADQLHTSETVEQMRQGEPLSPDQRAAWFERVIATVEARDRTVLACSALRRAQRTQLQAVGDVRVVLLDASASVLERRLRRRHGHFFPARLLESQLETLERPLPDEEIVVVDADAPTADVLDAIVANLEATA